MKTAFFTVFVTVFLAELGDKTQLATMLYASKDKMSPLVVFLAASLALVASTGLAVVAGGWISNHVDARWLTAAAGVGFIAVGAWTLLQLR